MASRKVPLFPLELVRAARVIRVARGKAREAVRQRFDFLQRPMTEPQTEQYVQQMVQKLLPGEFVETREQVWLE